MIRKHAFKKGVISNPRGRGASLPLKKEMRRYTTAIVAEIYNKLSEYTRRELRSVTIDPEAPALEIIIAKALLRDMRNSDQTHTQTVLNRIIGPIPLKQEIMGGGGAPLLPPQIVIQEVIAPKVE